MENGKLIVKLDNVVEVNLNYILRVDDYANKLEKHLIYNKNVSDDTKGMLPECTIRCFNVHLTFITSV